MRSISIVVSVAIIANSVTLAANDDEVFLHQLPGRKLHLRAGKSAVLRKAVTHDDTLRNMHSADGQYLIRVEFDARSQVQTELRKYSPYVQYLPHDTYVVVVKLGDLTRIANLRGVVEILQLPDILKVEPSLSIDRPTGTLRPGRRRESCIPRFLNVLLAQKVAADEVVSYCNVASSNQTICHSARLASDHKLVVATDTCSEGQAVWQLAQHPSIVWIEGWREVSLRNKYARRIVQSSDGSSELLWSKALFGDGEVIGITDTGVDFKNCFFADPDVELRTCLDSTYTEECVNPQHRKIISYRYFKDTNVGDTFEGHGTHVCGAALGSASAAAIDSTAPDHDGIAKNAKLAFDDISLDGSKLAVPDDLNTGLFPHSYQTGARTQSLSWGVENPSYDSLAMEVDRFMYEHDDYLVLVAAGNEGPSFYSVGSPATAKNILAVGASLNSLNAMYEYGDLTPAVRVVGGPTDAVGRRYLIQPADFGAQVRVGLPKWTGQLVNTIPADACSALVGEVSGKIALIQRGTCEFGTKALNAQKAGAIAALVVNNVKSEVLIIMSAGSDGKYVHIPSVFMSMPNGVALASYMATSAVNITFPEDAALLLLPEEQQETMNRLADFSSRGPTYDQRIKPDVVCPGQNIRSALSGMPRYIPACDTNSIVEMSGTSMATPNCAGSSALVRQYFREGFHVYGWKNLSTGLHATSALVKAVMIHSGRPIFNMDAANPTVLPKLPDVSQGYGRVGLSSVLFFGAESGFNLSVWNRESISHGEMAQRCVQVHSSAIPLRATLVWTDPPGTPASSKILVNDLDLTVEAPDGRFYWGNAQTQWDEAHGEHAVADILNNCEQVTVPTPSTGRFVVRVKATDVAVGPQRYAMVITGSFSMTSDCNPPMRCPSDCSGHGACRGGACECAIGYSGLDCSLQNVVLKSAEEYSLAVSSQGWAYYSLGLPKHESIWQLHLRVETGDPDFYLAFNRTPSWDDYEFADAGWWSNVNFNCNASCSSKWGSSAHGIWVLGVNSQCCDNSRAVATLNATIIACSAEYRLSGGECKACTTLTCPVGEYRSVCTTDADGSCIGCSGKPVGATFTSAGVPFDQDNCRWTCDLGLHWDGNQCSFLSTTAEMSSTSTSTTTKTLVSPSISTVTKALKRSYSTPSTTSMLTSSLLSTTPALSTTPFEVVLPSQTSTLSVASTSQQSSSLVYRYASTNSSLSSHGAHVARTSTTVSSDGSQLHEIASNETTSDGASTSLAAVREGILTTVSSAGGTVLVILVGLPMTVASFTAGKSQYIGAVAATALCGMDQVHVLSVIAYNYGDSNVYRRGQRRLLGENVQVRTQIIILGSAKVTGPTSAEAMMGLLTASGALDKNLKMQGLPASLGLAVVTDEGVATTREPETTSTGPFQAISPSPSNAVPIAVSVAVGCVALFSVAALTVRYVRSLRGAAGFREANTSDKQDAEQESNRRGESMVSSDPLRSGHAAAADRWNAEVTHTPELVFSGSPCSGSILVTT